jgi:hypothetical protein
MTDPATAFDNAEHLVTIGLSVGGMVVSTFAIIAGWMIWRSLVDEHIGALKKKNKEQDERIEAVAAAGAEAVKEVKVDVKAISTAQIEFEKTVVSEYVRSSVIDDLRAAMERGFSQITEQLNNNARDVNGRLDRFIQSKVRST